MKGHKSFANSPLLRELELEVLRKAYGIVVRYCTVQYLYQEMKYLL
jgi:hypothetical protein